MISWNDAEFLAKLVRWVPYALILFGLLIAAGQFLKIRIDSRIADLRQSEEAERKNTRPVVDASLGNSESKGNILLQIVPSNKIPFKARWLVVTENNQVVSGILLEEPIIIPKDDQERILYEVTINNDKVVNNYIELRFSFESVYAPESINAEHLKGEIKKQYRYIDGVLFHWKID